MQMKMFKQIGIKLIIGVGATTILIISVFSYFNIRSHSSSLLAEVERHANQLSETVKSSTRYDMLLNQRERIHNTINTIGSQPGIAKIRVLNKGGKIIYSSDKEEIGEIIDKKAESCYACHSADRPIQKLSINERTRIFRFHTDSGRVLGIINPIYNEHSCWEADCHVHSKSQTVLGVLDVTMPLNEVDRQIRIGAIEIVIFAVVAFLAISIIIGFFVRRWVILPVKVLLKATNEIGVGNLNYTIEIKSDDEMGVLARSFNNMTKKLSEARMQLFQSDKMASLGRLAAGVAHEINNPLTGVLTYSSFLLKRTKDRPEIQEDLKVIVRETIRSREIVKSLLDFSRQSVPKKNSSDMNDIIIKSIEVVENQLTINHVKLIKNLNKDLPKIKIDSNQMQQVFINLLVNASDAIGPKGGTITITSALLSLNPYGTMQIKRAQCPKRHSLIDKDFKIDGLPSIKFKAKFNGADEIIHLDPVYGKSRHSYDNTKMLKKDARVLCPDCGTSLIEEGDNCPECGSRLYGFDVPMQGRLLGCLNKECGWQKWDVVDKEGTQNVIEIKLEDTGCGISKEDLSRIFDPFYSTKGQKGTGLGLAVIWGIIDNHEGSIIVNSEINKGTIFTIHLPL